MDSTDSLDERGDFQVPHGGYRYSDCQIHAQTTKTLIALCRVRRLVKQHEEDTEWEKEFGLDKGFPEDKWPRI